MPPCLLRPSRFMIWTQPVQSAGIVRVHWRSWACGSSQIQVRAYDGVTNLLPCKWTKNYSIHNYTGFHAVSNLLSAPVALLLALFGMFLSKQDVQVLLGHSNKSERISLTLSVRDPSVSAPLWNPTLQTGGVLAVDLLQVVATRKAFVEINCLLFWYPINLFWTQKPDFQM